MIRKFQGVNTNNSAHIGESESKFNLNCEYKYGELKQKDYSKDFELEPTDVYEREYTSRDFTADKQISRYSLEFNQEDYYYTMNSGILKPTVSLYVDTTKDKSSSGYLAANKKLDNSFTFMNGKTLFGEKLKSKLENTAYKCEVYQNVEIAVSFSGPYGESGLTKFNLQTYTLHGFIFINNFLDNFMTNGVNDYYSYPEDDINPNYKYVNVYIKYGNMEQLQLLRRIDITTEEFKKSYIRQIDIDAEEDGITSNNFYSYFNKDAVYNNNDWGFNYETGVDNGFTDDTYKDNNFLSKNGCTLAIYTGLFQFEDPEKMNYSWFISNNISQTTPIYNTEIQTFLSSDDYDILENKYNNLVSSYEDNYNGIVDASNDVPYVIEYGYVYGWDTDRWDFSYGFYDEMFQYRRDYTSKLNYNPVKSHIKVDAESSLTDIGDVAWGVKYNGGKHKESSSEFDWKTGYNDIGGFTSGTERNETTGTLLFQFFIEDNKVDEEGYSNIVDRSYSYVDYMTVDISNGTSYSSFKLKDFGSNWFDNNQNWKVDIWFSKIFDINSTSDDITDKNWYRVFSEDCISIQKVVGDSGVAEYHNTLSSIAVGYPQKIVNNNMGSELYTRRNLPYRAAFWMANKEGNGIDLEITLDVGFLYKHRDKVYLDFADESKGFISDERNVEDDFEDLTTDTDGTYNTDYKILENGIKITNVTSLNHKYNYNHIETYDGRLWVSCQEKSDDYNYKDLYYSQQTYPEMILETNYKGYDSHITGLKEFIEQLYVFENNQINIVRKNLTRELNGIIEPTYQYHKTFDKGALEYSIQEYEKKLYFTNEEGMFMIDASGNYNKISENIDKIFYNKLITEDNFAYSYIKDDFYVIKLKESIDPDLFFDYVFYGRTPDMSWHVKYIAYNIKDRDFWFGNDYDISWVYMSKDFDARNQYEDFSKAKQLKRISFDYDGFFYMWQVRDKKFVNRLFKFPEQDYYGSPTRHTLGGFRNFYYGFTLIGNSDTIIRDVKLVENGK